ncbi:TRAFAC clade GTPase domain-containing protein [Sorangium sp. So ce381]|uniref:TRAFAC clade GTPase domain-containing protein n=1 Tax=Sorangium sp. So ce381 TaxID=3133307 RepID=UPI003F5B00FB
MPPLDLHVALFGASGAGKTVLLAAFYRAQTQPSFQQEHAYKIQAVNKAQGNQLLGRFYRLEEGRFPDGSTRFDAYEFDFFPRDLPDAAVRIHWYDYPGRWWEDEPIDAEEREAMRQGLLKLGMSHVGILLADGAKYRSEGTGYIRWLFEHFADECDRLRRTSAAAGDEVSFPREWILALSKADLFPPEYSASDFEREVCRDADDQLAKLCAVLRAESAFGHRFMLLSSVAAPVDADAQVDPGTSLGVRTLAPAILVSTVEGAVREAQATRKERSAGETFFQGLRDLVTFVDSLDDFLPKRYQIVSKILRFVSIKDFATTRLDRLQKTREGAIRRGDAFTAVLTAMAAALRNDEGARAYHQNQ